MIRQPRRSRAALVASDYCAVLCSGHAAAVVESRKLTTTRFTTSCARSQVNENQKLIKFILTLVVAAALLNTCDGAWLGDYEEGMKGVDALTVGRSAHEPKFGERLLPLRKKTSANLRFGGTVVVTTSPNFKHKSTTTTTPINTATTTQKKSVNNFNLDKNNYIVSNTQQQQQQQQLQKQQGEQEQQLINSDFSEIDHRNISDIVDDVTISHLPDNISVKKHRRQSKQLYRRQDMNVAEVIELPEESLHPSDAQEEQQQQQQQYQQLQAGHNAVVANASSLKADRFIVMSTEFFIVPTPTSAGAISLSSSSIGGRSGGSKSNNPSTATTRNPLKTRNSMKNSRVVPTHTGGGDGNAHSVLIVAPKGPTGPSSNANVNFSASPPTIVSTYLHNGGLRKEPWVVPVLVLATLTMLMMAAFEIFVLFKAWRTSPSRRHLFLGQMLLLGLFACAGLGAIITAQPSVLTCGTLRFGVGVAYALVFAALLVKCVFLISLNGGVYLPAPYQGLLLLFAVLIQVAIGTQWLLTSPPQIYTLSVPIVMNDGVFSSASVSSATAFARVFSHTASTSATTPAEIYTHATNLAGGMLIPLCKTQFSELLLSLIYIVFLIVFVSVLAIKSRGIRDNYREATYIGLAIGGAIPIWLGWMLCGLAVAERHKDACIAFGLVATSATVFLVMFMPKGRQLAAMGKEGLYVEDREEQFSSLSRAGSGYSPSFFHFKPIKYGVMGGIGVNSASNTANATSMKHCSNGLNGGDRVALVTAAPPSYTRMYHYFPAHLTHPFCFYPQPPPPQPPPPPPLQHVTQLAPPPPPTLKQLGNSITSMTQAHIAQTLRYPGLFIRPDETNLYTTLEPTLSSNPNVYFQRGNAVHPGMMY